ncbi:DUF397 domain-containing protein [Streptomyces sp. NPDC005752]|uniref:DUF397 domain-containing protein n=1 Tax=Streptomyces sp. NPDC005752 TaxID=3157065 RepID=UPI0033EEFAE5
MTRAAHGTNLSWFKSSHSSDQGGNCLEVACDWRRSSYSGSGRGDRVEVSAHPTAVHIRDSKVTGGPVLTVQPTAWAAFVSAAA